jgi:L-alanine-DL-glutamate epimerase-like enolase superfamily enzyme
MRIREIRAAGLHGATPAGGWTHELKPNDTVHTLVAVHTDEGLVGIGSVFTSGLLVAASLQLLNDLLIGENPLEVDRVTEKLHQNTFWMGRGGAVTHTISGINIALWDIAGQAYGQPVSTLLGGRYREKVTPYASVLMDDPENLSRTLARLTDDGFQAFKIGWGRFGRNGASVDEATVAAARVAVGPDALLAVDAGGSDAYWPHGYKWAINTAAMLANYDIAWFEEALAPDNLRGFVELRGQSRVPISGGETLTRRQAFAPFLDAGAFDIIQPDVTKNGGLSESMAIGRSAEDQGIKLVPHGWNTAVGLAADLHTAAALPQTDLVEYCTGAAYIDELVDGGWHRDQNGQLTIPSGPGLGLEWDHDAVARYTGGVELFAL